MNSKDILSKVFEITRDPRDGLHFLEEFKSLSPESFALLFADANTLLESSEALFSDIKLLFRLELYPILALEPESIQYLNVFYPPTKSQTSRRVGFPYHIINISDHIRSEVKECISSKKIPIIVWPNDTIHLDAFLFQIVDALNINKVIQLHHDGPIYDDDTGKVISLIPTGEELQNFKSEFAVDETDRDLQFITLAESLVSKRNQAKFSVVLTSPYTLLRELFTVKGSGTLVKKENRITHYKSMDGLDEKRLFQLIETSFRKTLQPSFKDSKFTDLFLEESYQGCAWLVQTEFGFLLSKFAVNETARGAGVGRDIWDLISNQTLPLYWRSKPNNNINKWYMKVAQGIEKDQNWYYYWLGLSQHQIPEIIKLLKDMPEDFIPN
ncbi:MAG: acetylglutamate kinase [Leptospira sp.]|jgi:hypothetical protein|nr:acetylglutamate kinase [Leptospira sp.]